MDSMDQTELQSVYIFNFDTILDKRTYYPYIFRIHDFDHIFQLLNLSIPKNTRVYQDIFVTPSNVCIIELCNQEDKPIFDS